MKAAGSVSLTSKCKSSPFVGLALCTALFACVETQAISRETSQSLFLKTVEIPLDACLEYVSSSASRIEIANWILTESPWPDGQILAHPKYPTYVVARSGTLKDQTMEARFCSVSPVHIDGRIGSKIWKATNYDKRYNIHSVFEDSDGVAKLEPRLIRLGFTKLKLPQKQQTRQKIVTNSVTLNHKRYAKCQSGTSITLDIRTYQLKKTRKESWEIQVTNSHWHQKKC